MSALMMGMPGGMEFVILLVVLGLLLFGGTTIARILPRRTPPRPPALPSSNRSSTEVTAARLAEADELLASGSISQAEHQAMRSQILGLPMPEDR